MMGFGSYGNGGPYPYSSSSSPSSLSALAPPFTVDRSSVLKPISGPLVDVTEPPYAAPVSSSLHNWLPSQAPTTGSSFFANPTQEFTSMPEANAYRYTGLQTVDPSSTNVPHLNTVPATSSNAFTYDQFFDVAATSFVEAKPYYPSYLSPTSHGDTPVVAPDQPSYDWLSASHFAPSDGSSQKDYTQRPSDSKYTPSWSGLWNGLAEWEQGKQGKFDGSFCSKKISGSGSLAYKSYMNQEPHSSNTLKSRDGASHGINTLGWEKDGGAAGDKSHFGKNSKFIPANFSKPVSGSLSVVPETHLKAPSSPFVTKITNCGTPYGVSSERRQRDASQDDIASFTKSSPAIATRPPAIGTRSSEPEKVLFKRVNFRSDASETDNSGYFTSGVQESHLPKSPEGKVLFNSSQLGIHLGTNDCFTVESLSTRNEELSNSRSNNKDAWDNMFKGKPGAQNSHVGSNGFNVALSTNETINSYLSSSDNVDPNNPAVDSPCWKGVPGSRLSPFEASEDGVPEQIKKLEDCNGLNIQMPLMFPINAGKNLSTQKRFKNTDEYNQFGWPENGLTFPFKQDSVANLAFGEHKLDDAAKTTYYSETSLDGGHQSYRDAQKSGHGDKSLGLQQGDGEDGLAIGVKQATESCGAEVKLNLNDVMEYASLHVPSHAVENMLCSSVENAATTVAKSNGEETMLKGDVQILVNTISSLSELLLINCSNGSYQLKKNDTEALKAVINNMHFCVSKNVEKWSPMQEAPSFQKSTCLYNGESSEHHKAVTEDRSLSAPSIQDQFIASVSLRSDRDMVNENKMTQAIKEILSANFHAEETDPQALLYKNLWLEAEAALCSVNYKARFNRVKIEMDKCKADKSKDVVEDTTDVMKQLWREVSHDSEPVDLLTPEAEDCPTADLQDLPMLSQEDDVLARFRILRSRVENSKSTNAANAGESSSKVSPEPNKIEKIAPEANGSPSPSISIEGYPSSNKTPLTNDDEASVMARFRIIRDRVENSKVINAVNVEEPSISKASVEPNGIAAGTSDGSETEFSIQDSPVSMITGQADNYEASVLSRLHILKSRVDNRSYMHAEGQQLSEPMIEVIAPEASDSFMPEFNIPNSPVSSTTGQANDCEASVLSRLNILQFRGDHCSYPPKEGQQQPEIAGLGYAAGMRYPWPIICKRSEGESSFFKEQPTLQSQKANSSTGKFITQEFHLFEDDPLPHYHRINTSPNQHPAGGHDNSSSDWEHVMKEEVWGQNC